MAVVKLLVVVDVTIKLFINSNEGSGDTDRGGGGGRIIQCIRGSKYNIVIATTNETTAYDVIINNINQNSYKFWLKCKNITIGGGCSFSSTVAAVDTTVMQYRIQQIICISSSSSSSISNRKGGNFVMYGEIEIIIVTDDDDWKTKRHHNDNIRSIHWILTLHSFLGLFFTVNHKEKK